MKRKIKFLIFILLIISSYSHTAEVALQQLKNLNIKFGYGGILPEDLLSKKILLKKLEALRQKDGNIYLGCLSFSWAFLRLSLDDDSKSCQTLIKHIKFLGNGNKTFITAPDYLPELKQYIKTKRKTYIETKLNLTEWYIWFIKKCLSSGNSYYLTLSDGQTNNKLQKINNHYCGIWLVETKSGFYVSITKEGPKELLLDDWKNIMALDWQKIISGDINENIKPEITKGLNQDAINFAIKHNLAKPQTWICHKFQHNY